MAGRDDFVYESRPVVRPLLLEYRDEDQVQLVEEGFVLFQSIFGARTLDNELDNKVSNTWILRLAAKPTYSQVDNSIT